MDALQRDLVRGATCSVLSLPSGRSTAIARAGAALVPCANGGATGGIASLVVGAFVAGALVAAEAAFVAGAAFVGGAMGGGFVGPPAGVMLVSVPPGAVSAAATKVLSSSFCVSFAASSRSFFMRSCSSVSFGFVACSGNGSRGAVVGMSRGGGAATNQPRITGASQ